jgi:hypothetical protein
VGYHSISVVSVPSLHELGLANALDSAPQPDSSDCYCSPGSPVTVDTSRRTTVIGVRHSDEKSRSDVTVRRIASCEVPILLRPR